MRGLWEKYRQAISGGLVALVTFAIFWPHTLAEPYFLDTFGYVEWIRKYQETGEFPGTYRLFNTYTYFFPVKWFGELGLKIVNTLVAAGFAATYYHVVKRDFGESTAIGACALTLTAPGSVLPITHLKEDFSSLLCLMLAFACLGPRVNRGRVLLGGAFYGLALLYKEFALIYAPFLMIYLGLTLSPEEQESRRDVLLRAGRWTGIALVGTVLSVLLIAPGRYGDFLMMSSRPTTGQFLGFFSEAQPVGAVFWAEAALYLSPWYLLSLVAFGLALKSRQPMPLFYGVAALVTWAVLANTTVIRARHFGPVFVFLCPLIVEGCRWTLHLLLEDRQSPRQTLSSRASLALAVVLAVVQFNYQRPTLIYRTAYNAQVEYYRELAKVTPEGSLILGMDCGYLARFQSGAEYLQHPVNPDEQEYEAFAERVSQELEQRPVLVLPDFFQYDDKGVLRQRFLEDFLTEPLYTGLNEDYHTMTYGPTIELAYASMARTKLPAGARQVGENSEELTLPGGLKLTRRIRLFQASDQTIALPLITFRGHATYLTAATVQLLKSKGERE